MFSKNKNQEKLEDKIISQVDQDLIVHNMPQGRVATNNSGNLDQPKSGIIIDDLEKKKHRMVGALIIGLGVILVGVLIFLSYRFIINPQSNNNQATSQSNSNQNIENNSQIDSEIEDEKENVVTTTEEVVSPEINNNEDEEIASSTEDLIDENMPEFSLVADSDDDGLTDEEEVIFQTDSNKADSDGDSYPDLSEIKNGYNPSGANTLEEAEVLTRYFSKVENFSFIYPASWEVSTANNDYTVIVSLPDNSLMQVSVQANNKLQDIVSWYKEMVSAELASEKVEGDNWSGIMGEDKMNFYLTDSDNTNIYVLSYISSTSGRIVYPNIFQLFIDSFKIE